jgi:hypothetical protein
LFRRSRNGDPLRGSAVATPGNNRQENSPAPPALENDMRRNKPNIIETAGLADWVATQKLTYETDERGGKQLALDTFLSGDIVVTLGDDEFYRGADVGAAVAAFKNA